MLTEDGKRFVATEYAAKKYNKENGEKIQYFTMEQNAFSEAIRKIHQDACDLKYSPLLEKYKDTLKTFNCNWYSEIEIIKKGEIYILQGRSETNNELIKIRSSSICNEIPSELKDIKEEFRNCSFTKEEKQQYQKNIDAVVKEAKKQYSSLLANDDDGPIVKFTDILRLDNFNRIVKEHELQQKIEEVQKKLTEHECKAFIFNDENFHATLCLVTKEKLVFLPMIPNDYQRISHPLKKEGFSVISLDEEKFYIAPGEKTIQMDSKSCHMLEFNIAKQMLKPRTDGKEGLMIHQALETLKKKEDGIERKEGDDDDIKIANLPQEVQDKIMKYSQPIYDNLYVKDLSQELQDAIVTGMMDTEHEALRNVRTEHKKEAIVSMKLTKLTEELQKQHLSNQNYQKPILNQNLITKLTNGGFVKDGRNTYLEYQTFKYDQLYKYSKFLNEHHTSEEKLGFRKSLENERKLPFTGIELPDKVPTHLHKFDAKNFLLKLKRVLIKEDKRTFENKLEDRLGSFQDVLNGGKSLSEKEISHLNPEEQKDVASKALKLLKRSNKQKASDPNTDNFLSKLEKAWSKEHPSTFNAKFERRFKRFNDIAEGTKSLSTNYISYDITNLNREEQTEVAKKALELLRKGKPNTGAEK
jgi:hypothetical protein